MHILEEMNQTGITLALRGERQEVLECEVCLSHKVSKTQTIARPGETYLLVQHLGSGGRGIRKEFKAILSYIASLRSIWAI